MSDAAPVVDWEFAREGVGQDEELLLDLVKTFLQEGPETMNQLRGAIAAQNGKELERTAHTLKGSLRIFKAAVASQAAWALEQKGKQRDTTGTEPLVADLQQKLAPVIHALTAFAAGQTPP